MHSLTGSSETSTSTPRTPEQNNIVEIRNRTLVEAARTMLSASKLPLFFWAEAITTACYTQNISIIILTHEKMAYHIINDRKPSIKHLHIFGCTCYLTRDGENLDKIKEKRDPCILIEEISETSVANDTSGLNTLPSTNIHLTTETINFNTCHAEENSNDQAEFTNPFGTPDSGFEKITAFSDADHAGCIDTRKSTSGGIQFVGDKLVSWMLKKQDCTAMSSA
ncbi:retrovirus-related pol polyprotein from transposon TNT 1-94 [Tanacetum coccineum]